MIHNLIYNFTDKGLIKMEQTFKESEIDLSLKLFVVMSRSFQSVQKKIIEDINKHGLNQTEFAVLELLYNKGDQAIQKIGKKILLASSSMTYVIDKLEEKKLIERKSCPKDRRVTYAHITHAGMDIMNDVFPQHAKAVNNIFSSLTKEEKLNLISTLKKVGLYAEDMV